MQNFADRFHKAAKDKRSVVCVGLDPVLTRLPAQVLKHAINGGFDDVAEAFEKFSIALIESVYDVVPIVKPNIAFFEQLGAPGVEAYSNVVSYAKEQGLLVIGDVKRGDIKNTADKYAGGHIGRVEFPGGKEQTSYFDSDAITVSPYFGTDGIEPFTRCCSDKGIFILCKTSNKSSAEFQDRLVVATDWERQEILKRLGYADGDTGFYPVGDKSAPEEVRSQDALKGHHPFYMIVALKIDEWGKNFRGEDDYSSVGAVVGATHPEQAKILRKIMPNTFLLVPGYGSQGATADDVMPNFDDNGMGATVNSSSKINFAYMDKKFQEECKIAGHDPDKRFGIAAREAAIYATKDINDALLKAGKVYWE